MAPEPGDPSQELIEDFGLFLISQQPLKFDKELKDFGLPQPHLREWGARGGNFILHKQLNWIMDQLCASVTTNSALFNNEQR